MVNLIERILAAGGDTDALLNLAREADWGTNGTPKDTQAALSAYRKAAEGGNREAMEELAAHLEWGQGCEIDTPAAADWYAKAAEAGSIRAAASLGMLYYQGAEDFPRDWDKAEEFLSYAADEGDEEAEDALDALLSEKEARRKRKERKAKKQGK